MKKLVCEVCGGNDIQKQDDFFICQYCGIKYTVEDVRKIIGTVKIDNTDKLNGLYQIARTSKADNNFEYAIKYYDMILTEDPTSWEASFYSVVLRAMVCHLQDIITVVPSVINCLDVVLKLIKTNISDYDDQNNAIAEIYSNCKMLTEKLFEISRRNYEELTNTNLPRKLESIDRVFNYTPTKEELLIGSKFIIVLKNIKDYVHNVFGLRDIMYNLGNKITHLFDNNVVQQYACDAWETGILYHSTVINLTDEAYGQRIWIKYTLDAEGDQHSLIEYTNKIKEFRPLFEEPVMDDK